MVSKYAIYGHSKIHSAFFRFMSVFFTPLVQICKSVLSVQIRVLAELLFGENKCTEMIPQQAVKSQSLGKIKAD